VLESWVQPGSVPCFYKRWAITAADRIGLAMRLIQLPLAANLMTWLFEEPLYIVATGLLLAAGCGWFWLQTGKRMLLQISLGCLLLTAVSVIIEQVVETDREQVSQTLHELAAAVESNDLSAVLAFIHPEAVEIRQRASAEMPIYTFEEVKVKQNLRVEFPAGTERQAKALFNVVVVGRGGGLENIRRVPRFVIVEFVKTDERWLVRNYEHDDPRAGFRTGSLEPDE